MSFEQLLVDYRTYLLAQEKSHHTVTNFSRDIGHFLAQLKDKDISTVTASDVDRWLVSVSTMPDGTAKHTNTINRSKTALRSFFTWAVRSNLIAINPAEHLHIKRVDRLPPTYLTAEEEKQLLDCLRDHPNDVHWQRDTAIIQLLLNTGIRVGELAQINLTDLDGKHLIVRHQKGGSPIRKFLPSATRGAIDEYIHGERERFLSDTEPNALFINQQGGRLISRGIQILVTKWVRLAGIDKPITPHKLRHTFATSLYAKNHDILVVQKALGHRSIVHTQIYAHVADDVLESAMEGRASDFRP